MWKHECKKCSAIANLRANKSEVEFVGSNFAVAMLRAMGFPGVKEVLRKGK